MTGPQVHPVGATTKGKVIYAVLAALLCIHGVLLLWLSLEHRRLIEANKLLRTNRVLQAQLQQQTMRYCESSERLEQAWRNIMVRMVGDLGLGNQGPIMEFVKATDSEQLPMGGGDGR